MALREYKQLIRWECTECGLEIGDKRVHDEWHEENTVRKNLDVPGEATIREFYRDGRAANVHHHFYGDESMTSRPIPLRSDGEWPV